LNSVFGLSRWPIELTWARTATLELLWWAAGAARTTIPLIEFRRRTVSPIAITRLLTGSKAAASVPRTLGWAPAPLAEVIAPLARVAVAELRCVIQSFELVLHFAGRELEQPLALIVVELFREESFQLVIVDRQF
jgi:hypothetical protein